MRDKANAVEHTSTLEVRLYKFEQCAVFADRHVTVGATLEFSYSASRDVKENMYVKRSSFHG